MTIMAESNSKTLVARCYCNNVHFTLTVKKAQLPLKTHICHCSVCRYTHGALCVFHAPLPAGVAPHFVSPSSMAALTGYRHSSANSTRYHCNTCGCQIGDHDEGEDIWYISTSIFADSTDFLVTGHVYSQSAADGGLRTWLKEAGGNKLNDWNPGADDPTAAPLPAPKPAVGPNGEERLLAQCHCGGVSLTIPRPAATMLDDNRLRGCVSPLDNTKWAGCVDVCDDCRLTSGSHVSAWIFVRRSDVLPTMGPDLVVGTSKVYRSSPDVLRTFCGVCGATVFYAWEGRLIGNDGGDQVLDLAIGLLRAPEGPLAENWITWRTGRLAWKDSGLKYDEGLTRSLSEGMKTWGKAKYHDDMDFEIP